MNAPDYQSRTTNPGLPIRGILSTTGACQNTLYTVDVFQIRLLTKILFRKLNTARTY